MGTLDAALARVSAQLAEIGALQNRLTAGQELALRAGTGFEAARSQIQDADYTALARDAVLQQTRTESGLRALRLVHRLRQEAVASLLG
jgi:flagellin